MEKKKLTLKKIIKLIGGTLLIMFIFLAVITVVVSGGAGDRAQYYYLKGIYGLFNTKNEPLAEIVIDLTEPGSDFIINNAKPTGWLYPFDWWSFARQKTEPEMEKEKRLGLRTALPANPFQYFTVKIIWDEETTFKIGDTKVVIVHFKDYIKPKYHMKNPEIRGINSVKIFCLDGHPVLENGRLLQRRTDYEFALAQHQKLAALLTNLGFARDVHADENQKNIINKRLEEFDGMKHLQYKTWTKGNFEFTLTLELFNNKDYMNSIYINSKNKV